MNKRLILLIGITLTFSCTKLEPKVLDEALNSNLLNGPNAVEGILAPVYARMHDLFNQHERYFLLQEGSTDEVIVPYRGGTDWFNGGVLIEVYKHTWTPTNRDLVLVWQELTQGIARAALAVNTLSTINDPRAASFTAEARAMGAFYNYILLDLYGLSFERDPATINSTDVLSKVLKGNDAINYILSEFDAAEGGLKNKSEVGAGRFTKAAAAGIKARIFLNKAVYLDRYASSFNFSAQDMDKVIENCNKIINSPEFTLETVDYFKIFDVDNHNHSEHIFALDQRSEANGSNQFIWFTLSRSQHGSLTNLGSTGTDGASTTKDFYDTWMNNTNDPRFYKENLPQSDGSVDEADYAFNRGFLQGQQYGIVLNAAKTGFKKTNDGKLVVEKLINTKRTGEPVNFTIAVDLEANTGHSAGVRVSKYEFDPISPNGQTLGRVDIPLIRLGDIYLMRAEAKLRKNDVIGALSDVNAIRTARKHPQLITESELDLEAMLKERGFELYWEMVRRTDLIRYGKFENTWTSKTNNDVHRRLYSIPQDILDRNPGFLEQNP